MITFLQLVVAGVSVGATFSLVGTGMVLVFRTTNALNFAQGAPAIVAGLTTSSLVGRMPLPLAGMCALVVATSVGAVVGLVTLSRGGSTTPLVSLIVTLGLALVAQASELLVFGDLPHTYAGVATTAWDVGGILIQPQYALILAVTLVATGALTYLLKRTVVGNALVACSDSETAARMIGLDTITLGTASFALAALLGGVAGLLLTPITPMTYDSDVALAINGFAAAAFGNLTSITATLAGGLILGVAEKLVVGYIDPQYELAIALVIMLAIIGWRARRDGLLS